MFTSNIWTRGPCIMTTIYNKHNVSLQQASSGADSVEHDKLVKMDSIYTILEGVTWTRDVH